MKIQKTPMSVNERYFALSQSSFEFSFILDCEPLQTSLTTIDHSGATN